jgi:hypothetical protein
MHDLGNMIAGPFATVLLGDLGAEVVKAEHPVYGDDLRQWPPQKDGQPRGARRRKTPRGMGIETSAISLSTGTKALVQRVWPRPLDLFAGFQDSPVGYQLFYIERIMQEPTRA